MKSWTFIFAAVTAFAAKPIAAEPKNFRPVGEMLAGAMPSVTDIDDLYAAGVRVVVSLAVTPAAVRARIASHGMRHVYAPIGSRFPSDADGLLDALDSFGAGQVYVHCQHGSDRTGVFLAFVLSRRYEWPPARALLSVLEPSDLPGLEAVLAGYGIAATDDDRRHLGEYAGSSGLKARDDRYRRLIRTMLAVLLHGGKK